MGECEKVGKMRFYPKPARWPEFPAPNRQGLHLGRHVPVFFATRAAPEPARRRACGRVVEHRSPPPRAPGVRHAFFQPICIVTVVSRQLTLDLGTPPPATFDNFIM
ncbi:TPA: hypothetical protein ACYLIM_007284, partial [Burkholderia cenocepacia]